MVYDSGSEDGGSNDSDSPAEAEDEEVRTKAEDDDAEDEGLKTTEEEGTNPKDDGFTAESQEGDGGENDDDGGGRKKTLSKKERQTLRKHKAKSKKSSTSNANQQAAPPQAHGGYGYGYGYGPMSGTMPPGQVVPMGQMPMQNAAYGAGMPNSQGSKSPGQQQQPPMFQQGFHHNPQMVPQGGYPGHFMVAQPQQQQGIMVQPNSKLSTSAFATLATVTAATENFLTPKSNTFRDFAKSARHKELVIKIRKDTRGNVVGSSITIESVKPEQEDSEDEHEVYRPRRQESNNSPPKKKKRKQSQAYVGDYPGEEDEAILAHILGPNPSLEDLSNYTRELFQEELGDSRNEDVDDPDGEKLAANIEKAEKTASFFPKMDVSYTSGQWDDKLKQYLTYVAIHKTWVLKKNTVPYPLRKWLVEQKYQYRNTFTGAVRSSDFILNKKGESLDNEEADLSRRHMLTQEKYQRFYRAGFPFPKMVAAEGKTLESILVLHPPFPPIENRTNQMNEAYL